jgi:hypothetical protein
MGPKATKKERHIPMGRTTEFAGPCRRGPIQNDDCSILDADLDVCHAEVAVYPDGIWSSERAPPTHRGAPEFWLFPRVYGCKHTSRPTRDADCFLPCRFMQGLSKWHDSGNQRRYQASALGAYNIRHAEQSGRLAYGSTLAGTDCLGS